MQDKSQSEHNARLTIMPLTSCKPGMMIVEITEQNGPVRIKKSGMLTSQDMIKGLSEMGVQTVKVDLAASVEIESDADPDHIPKTQTQQLFMQSTQRNVDASMSEQFHRSLFLPSLRALPSRWQVQAKNVGQFVIVIGLGLGLGYGAALGLQQAPWHEQQFAIEEPLSAPESNMATSENETAKQQESNVVLTEQTNTPPDNVASATTTPEKGLILESDTLTETTTLDPASSTETEGVIINEPQDDATSLSPDITAKLNQVLADLGEPSLAQQSSAANSAVASNSPPKDADSPDDENNTYLDEIRNDGLNVLDTIPRIDQLPVSVLSRMPAMVFAQHMYSSNDAQRWVRVNNRRLGEGDAIDQNVTIVRIEPQHVILSFQGREFKMNALSDW